MDGAVVGMGKEWRDGGKLQLGVLDGGEGVGVVMGGVCLLFELKRYSGCWAKCEINTGAPSC